MTKEETIYKILFPEDDDPNHINYGHFLSKNKRTLYKFKALVYESQLNAVLIMDGKNRNAFYVEVLQSELESFLILTNEFNFKQIKMDRQFTEQVVHMFKDYLLTLNSKNHRFSSPVENRKQLQYTSMCGSF
ncbi:hypothetical protein [Clostridium sp.]|uniref:hypothetical protein n=1 Tax=Clostridium sp. TaxID=1506 RepID=UPI003D6C992E